MRRPVSLFLFVALFAAAPAARAEAPAAAAVDIPARYTYWDIRYDVAADGSYVETQRWATRVLKESAVEDYKTAAFSFSASLAHGAVLEAATLKPGGERVEAARDNYQYTLNNGYAGGAPSFNDVSSIAVVFPDLAAGDTAVFAYSITNTEAMFPGHFSADHAFSEFVAFDDVRITITAPRSMKLHVKAYALEAAKPVVRDGKQTLVWRYRNPNPRRWSPEEAGLPSVGDRPSLYVSTFDSYAQLAQAYGARATPKAKVTPRVAALAEAITRGAEGERAQARAIYEWVSRNVTYAGNLIGVGAVVPRDLDVVLDNKMGDCKDHATLLQALLAAKGIASDQVLIHAGSQYELPPVPVVSAIDHAINYIPSLDLYVDSTATRLPFGMLPSALGEKPVLNVSAYREGAKTPATAQYGHRQVAETRLWIDAAGGATGTTTVELRGDPAVAAREALRSYRRDQEENFVRRLLDAQGSHGTGRFEMEDPAPMRDTFRYALRYSLEDAVVMASTTGMRIAPVVATFSPLANYVRGVYEPKPKKPQRCKGGDNVERYTYVFPATVEIVGYPKDFTHETATLAYTATYRLQGNVLTVERTLHDKTPHNVCTPAYSGAYMDDAKVLLRDLKAQVLIRTHGD